MGQPGFKATLHAKPRPGNVQDSKNPNTKLKLQPFEVHDAEPQKVERLPAQRVQDQQLDSGKNVSLVIRVQVLINQKRKW